MTNNDEVNRRIAELLGEYSEHSHANIAYYPQYTDDWAACGVLLEELLKKGGGELEWDDATMQYAAAYHYWRGVSYGTICCDAIAHAWLAWKEGNDGQ